MQFKDKETNSNFQEDNISSCKSTLLKNMKCKPQEKLECTNKI